MEIRKGVILLLLILIVVLLLSYLAFSGVFTSSLIPSTINEDNSTLLNITINNTDTTANITFVNVTLFPNSTFASGTNGTSASNTNFSGSATNVIWQNTTTTGFVENGTWQYFWFNLTASQPGIYNITINTFFTDGTTNQSIESITVNDTTPPAVFLIVPTNGTISNVATQTFNCTVNDNYNLANVTIHVWNSTNSLVNQTTTAVSGTSQQVSWAITLPSNDTFHWNCLAYDAASNSNWNSTNFTLTVDQIKPFVQFVNPSSGIYNSSTVNITATDASGLSQIQIRVNDSTVYNCTSSPCTYPLSNGGNYTVYGVAVDNAANINQTEARQIIIDVTAPQFYDYILSQNLTGEQAPIYINASDWFTGIAGNVTLDFNGTSHNMGSSGNATSDIWNFTINSTSYLDGVWPATFIATDQAGNTNQTTINVTIDNHAPDSLHFILPDPFMPSQTYMGFIQLNITLTDSDTGIKTAIANVSNTDTSGYNLYSLSLNDGNANYGNWTSNLNVSNLSDGNYLITVNATDWVNLSNWTNVQVMIDNDRLNLSATSDDTPVLFNDSQTIFFEGNYTHVGQPINVSSNCYLSSQRLNLTNVSMTYNASAGKWQYSIVNNGTNIAAPGQIGYFVFCNNTLGYENITTTDSIYIIYNATMSGYVYNFSNTSQTLANATVTVTEAGPPDQQPWTYTNITNASGYYQIVFNDTTPSAYFIHITYYNSSGVAVLTSPILPPMPQPFLEQGQTQANITDMNFYLVNAATINITNATKDNNTINVSGELFVGTMPLTFFQKQSTPYSIVVPAGKDYDLTVYKIPENEMDQSGAPPVSYHINASNLTAGAVYPRPVNLTIVPANVTGYLRLNGTSDAAGLNYTNMRIYMHISSFVPIMAVMMAPDLITLNSSTGYFNISLPGGSGRAYTIVGFAKNESGGSTDYYVGNIEIQDPTTGNTTHHDITLYEALGSESTASGVEDVTTNKITFNFTDQNNNSITDVFMETNVTYPDGNSTMWMLEGAGSSTIKFFVPNGSSIKANVFSPRAPPRKFEWSSSYLQSHSTIHIPLADFDAIDPDTNTSLSNVNIVFLRNSSSCNQNSNLVYYPSDCLLLNASVTDFDPMKAMMAGTASIRLQTSNGVIVEFVGVDLINSGPPDAQYDSSAHQDLSSGSTFDKLWRLGSLAPDVYNYVLASVPYDSSLNESAPIRIKIKNLYWDNWSSRWSSGSVPSEYSDYNLAYFNGTGVLCYDNLSNVNLTANSGNGACFVNKTENRVWFTLPHFSGAGPAIVGSAIVTTSATTSETSGGGGGIAGITLEKKTHCWDVINAEEEKIIKVLSEVIGVEEVSFIVNKDVKNTCVEVKQLTTDWLKNKTYNLNVEMSEGLYKTFSIGLTNGVAKSATIQFTVNKTWLSNFLQNNNFSNYTIYLKRLVESPAPAKWFTYEATQMKQDDTFYYYESSVPGFSTFVVNVKGYGAEKPVVKAECGDNICQVGETQDNCCIDCGCPIDKECKDNQCVEKPKPTLPNKWLLLSLFIILIVILTAIGINIMKSRQR